MSMGDVLSYTWEQNDSATNSTGANSLAVSTKKTPMGHYLGLVSEVVQIGICLLIVMYTQTDTNGSPFRPLLDTQFCINC
jgi:hypothetical protein